MIAGYLLDISWWKYPQISRTVWPDLPPPCPVSARPPPATTALSPGFFSLGLSDSCELGERDCQLSSQSVEYWSRHRGDVTLTSLLSLDDTPTIAVLQQTEAFPLTCQLITHHGDSLLPSESSGKPLFLCSFSFLRQTRRRRQTNIW